MTNTETGADISPREELGSDAIIQEDRSLLKNHHVGGFEEANDEKKEKKMRYELGVIPVWLLVHFPGANNSFV